MTGKARLEFSDAARSDLIAMRQYGLDEFGREIADLYVDDIESVFRLLQDRPHAGQAQPDLGRNMRCFSKRRHRIFYRLEQDTVMIVRVVHHAMDAGRALR